MTDEALLQYYRSSGDNHWLGVLLQRYTLLLLGVAMKYLKDKELAQDAVQYVFLRSLTHLPDGEIQNFKGWLYVLMRNHCLQQLRNKTYPKDETAFLHLADATTDKGELERHDYTLEQMSEELNKLETEQRECIILFYLKKKSYQDIMDETGFSFVQVKSYIQNGKRNLKLALQRKLDDKQ
ncbi:MAG: sigma-70 family RNA polymerase sigma factor [Sphingobacteriales bacterium]|nr:MAG: sigma-70 family RNA polymerase sigma factor [Sphingobacteriales bacterium]